VESANRDARAAAYEALIRRYFDACNAADVEGVAACFAPDGVHYFPPGMYEGPFKGGRTIGERWRDAVERLGSWWSVDQVMVDPDTHRAVIEWSHFKTKVGVLLRGDEWYDFEPQTGLIREIRAYYAAPQSATLVRHELGGFDYAERGYTMKPPPWRRAGAHPGEGESDWSPGES
jgi:methyltransferase